MTGQARLSFPFPEGRVNAPRSEPRMCWASLGSMRRLVQKAREADCGEYSAAALECSRHKAPLSFASEARASE